MKYKTRIICVSLLFVMMASAGKPQSFEKQTDITKSFAVNKDCNIQLSNKYGDINIITWDKDSANFTIQIKVTGNDSADAEKLLKSIDVSFTNTPYYLVAKTVFTDNKSRIMSDIADFTNSLFNKGKNVEIKYMVSIPQTASLKAENKFGNVYTTNHSGNVNFIVSNGDLKANDLTGNDTKLDISFGNAVINSITNGRLKTAYSEMELKTAGKLSIEGKSTKHTISKAGALNINSKRDKYYIDTAGAVTGQSDFSYINVYYLQENIFIKSLYGEINLTDIAGDIKYIDINSDYTDIITYFRKSSSVSLNLICRKTVLSYPSAISGIKKTVTNEKTGEFNAAGTLGSGAQPLIPVQINAVSGKITLNVK